MSDGNTVLVVGTGTIGEPVISLLLSHKKEIGIDEIIFHKHTPRLIDRPMLRTLIKRGALMSVEEHKKHEFQELGLEPDMTIEEALKKADVVLDATKSGVGLKNKDLFYKKHIDDTKAFIAQGSEFGFGIMYAAGINDMVLKEKPKWITVASCNTHAGAALIKTLGTKNGKIDLKKVDLVYLRRSADISQTGKFTSAPTITRYKDSEYGTHHARDVNELFKTIGQPLNIFSSAIKLNTMLMHSVHYHLIFNSPVTREELIEKVENEPLVAVTYKDHLNQVFSFGRDHGHYGRILNEFVVSIPSILVRNETEVYGWGFTPQDGNNLLSNMRAIANYIRPDEDPIEVTKPLNKWLFSEV